eukprot:3400461-Lingulodinium_polyedra.AAC.1
MLARRPLRRAFFDTTRQLALLAARVTFHAWCLCAWRPPRTVRESLPDAHSLRGVYAGAALYTAHRARL